MLEPHGWTVVKNLVVFASSIKQLDACILQIVDSSVIHNTISITNMVRKIDNIGLYDGIFASFERDSMSRSNENGEVPQVFNFFPPIRAIPMLIKLARLKRHCLIVLAKMEQKVELIPIGRPHKDVVMSNIFRIIG